VREQAVRLRWRLRVQLLERLPDLEMELATLRLEQAPVRSVLDQPVPEAVLGCGAASLLDDELEALKLRQGGPHGLARSAAVEQHERDRLFFPPGQGARRGARALPRQPNAGHRARRTPDALSRVV